MAKVSDVMSKTLLTVEAVMKLDEAAREMHERNVGAALVLTNEHVSGILTERDVLRAVATGDVTGTRVAAWMTHDPETIGPDDSTAHAASLMIRGGFRHLPVVDESGLPVGIVSIRDLMRAVDDETPREA
jgi:CBS domain-containing protein